jgi:hypothetical protein
MSLIQLFVELFQSLYDAVDVRMDLRLGHVVSCHFLACAIQQNMLSRCCSDHMVFANQLTSAESASESHIPKHQVHLKNTLKTLRDHHNRTKPLDHAALGHLLNLAGTVRLVQSNRNGLLLRKALSPQLANVAAHRLFRFTTL